jgi:hypothetical protein
MNGIIRLYPTHGKIVEGSYVKHNNTIYHVKERLPEDKILLSGDVIVDEHSAKLLKLYVVNKTHKTELHYNDYVKVNVNQEVEYDKIECFSTAAPGDSVVITHVYPSDVQLIQRVGLPTNGTILKIESRIFTIEIFDGTILKLKRNMFKLKEKNNIKYVAIIKSQLQGCSS